MPEVGANFVSIVPSVRNFGRNLDSQIGRDIDDSGKRSGKRFGLGFATMAKGGLLAGGIAVGAFLKGALGEAQEAQKVGALTNAVIKSTGGVANVTAGQVDKLSASLSTKIGVDDEAIASGQNMLLTFGNVRNEIGKGNDIFRRATIAANDMAAAFGGDAVSNSKMLGKALNDPAKGVSALTRVGVSFTQQQKDQIKTLQESGDILGAQKIILGEVAKQTKGAAESQASSADKAKVAFGNLQESIGTLLLPVVNKMLDGFTRFAVFLTNNVGPGIAAVNGWIAPLVARVGDFFQAFSDGAGSGAFASIKASVLPVLQQMGTTFTTVVLPAVTKVAGYIASNVVPILGAIAGIVVSKVLPIVSRLAIFFYGTVYPAVVKIATAVAQNLKPVLDTLFQVIQQSVLPAVAKILDKFREWQPTLEKVVVVVLKVIGFVLKLASAILGKVLPVVLRFAGWLLSKLVPAVLGAIEVVAKIIGFLIDLGKGFFNAGKKAVEFAGKVANRISAAVGFVTGLPGKVLDAVKGFGTLLLNAGKDLIGGLIDGITSKIKDVKNAVGNVAGAVKDFFPGSPVKEGPLRSWNNGGAGRRLVDMLALGLDQTGSVEAASRRLASAVTLRAPSMAGNYGTVGASAGSSGSALHVENMYAANPDEAARKLMHEYRKALVMTQ